MGLLILLILEKYIYFFKCNSLNALISFWSVSGDFCVKSGQLNSTKSLKWFPKKWLCNYHNGQNLEHWLWWWYQMLVIMWSDTDSHPLLVELQNGIVTLEDSGDFLQN